MVTSLVTSHLRMATALLTHAQALAARHQLAAEEVQAQLLTAERQLREVSAGGGSLATARMAADDALRQATRGEQHREEALAHLLLGQCDLAAGQPLEAEAQLRVALTMLTERQVSLEAARARLALAEALCAKADGESMPEEARILLAEAQSQFATSGATLDLAQAERLLGVAPAQYTTGMKTSGQGVPALDADEKGHGKASAEGQPQGITPEPARNQ
jgi:hypothetical protein